MKWFWYSLIGFCLLMCSCKTKQLDSNVRIRNNIQSDLAYLNESVKISSQNNAYFANETQNIVIEEDITVTEYDKEGNKTKETNAKRKTIQNSDKVSTEEESQVVTECSGLEVEQFRDLTQKVESEVKEESIGGQESFGKWFGIILGISMVIIGFIVYFYIRKKLRINKLSINCWK